VFGMGHCTSLRVRIGDENRRFPSLGVALVMARTSDAAFPATGSFLGLGWGSQVADG
jgi:hypothetical protein